MEKPDFSFAFNSVLFSDRLLQFEVNDEAVLGHSKSSNVVEKILLSGLKINQHNEQTNQHNELQQLHVNSMLLAAHSNYFMKLFTNGMSESSSQVVVIRVTREERQGLYDLIKYVYTEELREPANVETVIMLLCLADRFSISSCIKPLVEMFKKFPSTVKDCLLVLDLPDPFQSNVEMQPVLKQCSDYLLELVSDVSAHKGEFLSLSLAGVKWVLDSERLNVQNEEEVFHYMVEWVETNCFDLESSLHAVKEIAKVVRFPWTTGDFLEDVVAISPLMEDSSCQALIMEAVRFRSFTHARQQRILSKEHSHNRFVPRNDSILRNFWGHIKTHVLDKTEVSCQAYFEFPMEFILCMSKSLESCKFSLGPDNKYTFHILVSPSTNYRNKCDLKLVWKCLQSSPSNCRLSLLDYSLDLKVDYSRDYVSKVISCVDLASVGSCNLLYRETLHELGSYDYNGIWKGSTKGPIFLRLILNLKERVS